MALIKLPKRLHPDFALLNRTPIGPVTIDWSNPLTSRLKWFGITDLGGTFHELVKKSFNVRAPKGYELTIRGMGQEFLDNNDDGVELFGTESPEPTNNEVTYFAFARWDATSESGSFTILAVNSPGTEFSVRLSQSSGGFNYKFAAASSTVAANRTANGPGGGANSFADGGIFLLAATATNTDLTLYLDGEQIAQTTFSASDLRWSDNENWWLGQLHSLGTSPFEGIVMCAGVTHSRWSDQQHRAFAKDMYQILKPVHELEYFTSAGAPPTGRIMSSLAYNGGLAGSGGIAGSGGGLAG